LVTDVERRKTPLLGPKRCQTPPRTSVGFAAPRAVSDTGSDARGLPRNQPR